MSKYILKKIPFEGKNHPTELLLEEAYQCIYVKGDPDKASNIAWAIMEKAVKKRDDELAEECSKLKLVIDRYKLYGPKSTAENSSLENNRRSIPYGPSISKKQRVLEVPQGKHKTFNFIKSKGQDPYRLAQVVDLWEAMNKPKEEGGLIKSDQKNFLNIFIEGETSFTVEWIGSIRELHYIIYQWWFRRYIQFEKEKEWIIASKLFTNSKKRKNGVATYFDSDELRTARNPRNITQDLEDIVEILNPNNPGKHYERFCHKAESRIGYRKNQK